MKTETKHYVTFYSPGTFVSESSRKPIDMWSPAGPPPTELACRMAADVVERHGAKPYAFRFSSFLEAADVESDDGVKLRVQPKELRCSGFYFLGGEVLTYDEVKLRGGDVHILLSNMSGNGYWHVCENRNSWLSTHPFGEDDVLLDPSNGSVRVTGRDENVAAYRAQRIAAREEERKAFAAWEEGLKNR